MSSGRQAQPGEQICITNTDSYYFELVFTVINPPDQETATGTQAWVKVADDYERVFYGADYDIVQPKSKSPSESFEPKSKLPDTKDVDQFQSRQVDDNLRSVFG